jgi:tRNA threonylcarbamoyladenosine biosynthesis protein TsaB
VPVPDGAWHGVGTGFAAGEGALVQRLRGYSTSQLVHVDDTQLPHAADLARLAAEAFEQGGAVAPDAVEPAYLRNNVALTLAEQQALRK